MNKSYDLLDFSKTESNSVRCPDEKMAALMINKIKEIRKQGDTIGGTISCVAKNIPVGLGEPIFNKLHAALGNAMLSLNALPKQIYLVVFRGVSLMEWIFTLE